MGPTASQGVLAAGGGPADDDASTRRTAIALIAVSGLLVVLALTLATRSLRRRSDITVPERPATDR